MSTIQEFHHAPPNQPPVRGFLHLPAHPSGDALVLTHGAGANCNAPLLVAMAGAFCDSGFAVLRCDLPFRQARPHGPPPPGSAARDQQGLEAAIASMRKQTSGCVFLGGHSYGGRQASMLAAAEPGVVDRLLLLSYPLHPPRRPEELRTTHFPRLQTSALFVHGARDGFGSIDELAAALSLIPAPTELLSVPGAGHELLTKQNRDDLPMKIVEAFRSFAK
ncbi:MAG: alpha/beta family hydrolase [Acidobacteriaceae bacterium]|jgi:predicted alpha/beta-hydrolase family hydrolase